MTGGELKAEASGNSNRAPFRSVQIPPTAPNPSHGPWGSLESALLPDTPLLIPWALAQGSTVDPRTRQIRHGLGAFARAAFLYYPFPTTLRGSPIRALPGATLSSASSTCSVSSH